MPRQTNQETDRLADRLEQLLEEATNAMTAGDMAMALVLVIEAHEIAGQLPKAKPKA